MDFAKIAASVIAAWQTANARAEVAIGTEHAPPVAVVQQVIATAFEASLLREENRPLTFRLILRSPDQFPEAAGVPDALQPLPFAAPRPFTAQELRRLTPAVDHDRSLVGVRVDDHQQLHIWGIVHSGPRWLEQFYGGRGNALDLPDALIAGVTDPGYLVVSRGSRPLCALEAGVLQTSRLNVFDSSWLAEYFADFRHELRRLHELARNESEVVWPRIDSEFMHMVGRQMIQRLISTIQRSRHGGTLLIVPLERADELLEPNDWIKLKYKFVSLEPQSRLSNLILRTMNTLASTSAAARGKRTVGWEEYGHALGGELSLLDEAIFEVAHMIATLTAVDGAVVVTRRFELLGFGGEIAGSLFELPRVARALDPEGNVYCTEPTEDVGTRHRSVYRLCNTLCDVLGIVVSQDGGARFVRSKNGQLMYWNHSSVTPP